MSNEITKEPEIRFDGYEGDWEQRKFNNLVVRVNKITNSNSLPKIEFEDILAGEGRLNKDVSQKFDNRKGVEFLPNDILYGKLRPYLKNWLKPSFTGVALGDFWVFRVIKSDSDFIYSLIQSDKYQRVANDTSGTKMPRSDWKKVSETEFLVPDNRNEQQKIGNFFKQLDDTIALHQRELDLLEQTKQTYLKKMFPKTGEDKPEICFAGFTDAWEQRMLGDVFSERSERSSEGELISVTINSGVVKASELDRKDNSSNDKSNYKKVEVGDIAYNSMRMWQGASGYSSYDGILSPAYTVIIPKEGIDSKFFAYDFKRHDMIQTFKRNSQGLTSDTWNLKFPTLKSVKVMVPCMEEQTKISNFFERLDTTITLHQRELDSLKEIKKTLLQKMFV
ncbi:MULTISPECIES: restriction endonuclease subunit S [Enterococcus]|uniref:restriction endonuclease subunit S n=1 Tax=Enterococcus TaxID=1350 RepID=UPI00265C899F|nr:MULTISPECIES: restriction endonuclease subunit S [unclassified Enterococcus]MDO0895017.1 restriction endonuclease subunit S [Enterococcus sp. B1E4]MDO0907970.1 restriction endonuclease subunit S [Enterococcus sp. B2E4]MDU3374395.1 restriction endonuclease subunit S [Enterococcus casseliflavus]